MTEKKKARSLVFTLRKQYNKKTLARWNHMLTRQVLSWDTYQKSDTILTYASFNNEADTYGIIDDALKNDKLVGIPRIENNQMHFYRIHSIGDLTTGYKGIPEPGSHCQERLAHGLMLMPGVAFDHIRNRAGYGKGFYDNYLIRQESTLKTCALAFEFQIFDHLKAENHDIKPNVIFTEHRIII